MNKENFTVGNIYSAKDGYRGYAYKCIVNRPHKKQLAFLEMVTGEVIEFNGDEYGNHLLVDWEKENGHRLEPSNLIAWPATTES